MSSNPTSTEKASDYPLRVLVCGGRDYADAEKVNSVLDQLWIAEVAHGAARGADKLADDWARQHWQLVGRRVYPADWNKHGKRAGILRNQLMLDDFQPDLVVAFPGGRGTAHMVDIAKKAGVEVLLVDALSGVPGVL